MSYISCPLCGSQLTVPAVAGFRKPNAWFEADCPDCGGSFCFEGGQVQAEQKRSDLYRDPYPFDEEGKPLVWPR
jgi:transcription elongation factor Elf1